MRETDRPTDIRQACELHDRLLVAPSRNGHVPPLMAPCKIEYVCVDAPLPHDFEHVPLEKPPKQSSAWCEEMIYHLIKDARTHTAHMAFSVASRARARGQVR